jgi:hypothetical protein
VPFDAHGGDCIIVLSGVVTAHDDAIVKEQGVQVAAYALRTPYFTPFARKAVKKDEKRILFVYLEVPREKAVGLGEGMLEHGEVELGDRGKVVHVVSLIFANPIRNFSNRFFHSASDNPLLKLSTHAVIAIDHKKFAVRADMPAYLGRFFISLPP